MRELLRQISLATLLLGGCSFGSEPAKAPPPEPHHSERPFTWISAEPECSNQMPRGQWLVCETPAIRTLHRNLATQWERQRIEAARPTIDMLQLQQRALISERAICVDLSCVENAYRRYLLTPSPTPTATPPPKPVASARAATPRPQPAVERVELLSANRLPGEQSCAAELGGSASAYLVRQCRVVNSNHLRACTADRTCADLRARIYRGCERSGRPPGFCNIQSPPAR